MRDVVHWWDFLSYMLPLIHTCILASDGGLDGGSDTGTF